MKIIVETDGKDFKECLKDFIQQYEEKVSKKEVIRDEETLIKDKISVRDILKEIGIPLNQLGYGYLLEAVEYCVKNKNKVSFTKELYPIIAKQNNTLPARVERAIRNSIETAWSYKTLGGIVDDIFKNTISSEKGKPTNSQFIYAIVEYLR